MGRESMEELGNAILSGAAGGAIAGIVVAFILGASRWIAVKRRRQDEIDHIREMITNDRRGIYDVSVESAPGDPFTLNCDVVRYALFDGMRRELEFALDGRSSEITFDEIRQIRRVFVRDDLLESKAPGRSPEGLRYYDGIFADLEKIDWLKLPPR